MISATGSIYHTSAACITHAEGEGEGGYGLWGWGGVVGQVNITWRNQSPCFHLGPIYHIFKTLYSLTCGICFQLLAFYRILVLEIEQLRNRNNDLCNQNLRKEDQIHSFLLAADLEVKKLRLIGTNS
jgi:hypothetical protein